LGKFAEVDLEPYAAGDCIDIVMSFGSGKKAPTRAAVVTEGAGRKALIFAPGKGGCEVQVGKKPKTTVKVKAGIRRYLIERTEALRPEALF